MCPRVIQYSGWKYMHLCSFFAAPFEFRLSFVIADLAFRIISRIAIPLLCFVPCCWASISSLCVIFKASRFLLLPHNLPSLVCLPLVLSRLVLIHVQEELFEELMKGQADLAEDVCPNLKVVGSLYGPCYRYSGK